MAFSSVPPETAPELLSVLDDLRRREPIFHRPEFPTAMAPGYWEIGASGRRYNREFILETLAQHPPIDAAIANWQATDFALQQLAPSTYLLTYTLDQAGRITRRSTLWQKAADGWQILYHQGTIVSAEALQEDATTLAKS
jgi:hypothetical protein